MSDNEWQVVGSKKKKAQAQPGQQKGQGRRGGRPSQVGQQHPRAPRPDTVQNELPLTASVEIPLSAKEASRTAVRASGSGHTMRDSPWIQRTAGGAFGGNSDITYRLGSSNLGPVISLRHHPELAQVEAGGVVQLVPTQPDVEPIVAAVAVHEGRSTAKSRRATTGLGHSREEAALEAAGVPHQHPSDVLGEDGNPEENEWETVQTRKGRKQKPKTNYQARPAQPKAKPSPRSRAARHGQVEEDEEPKKKPDQVLWIMSQHGGNVGAQPDSRGHSSERAANVEQHRGERTAWRSGMANGNFDKPFVGKVCFAGSNLVATPSGPVACWQLKAGAAVLDAAGQRQTVLTVYRSPLRKPALWRCGDALLTKRHPVWLPERRDWFRAAEIGQLEACSEEFVYNFEMSGGHSVVIGATCCATLGHATPGRLQLSEHAQLFGSHFWENKPLFEHLSVQTVY